MDDEDEIDKEYGVTGVHSVTTARPTRFVVKPTTNHGSTSTKRKYGPPKEIRLRKRNRCFIFSNRFQENPKHQALPQNHYDELNVEQTFQWFNFRLKVNTNMGYNDTLKRLNEVYRYDYSADECLVLFFITHGTDDGQLYANDMRKFSLDDVKERLLNISSLNGKPKLIFVQACRGKEPMETIEFNEVDGSTVAAGGKTKKAKDAEMFVYFSTTEGHLAWGNENVGSYFIKTLCGVLQEYGGDFHLAESVAKVNEVLAKSVSKATKQDSEEKYDVVEVGEVQHSLTSKLYFTPTGSFDDFTKTHMETSENKVWREDGSKRKEKKRTVIKVSTR